MIALKADPGGVRVRSPYVAMALLIAVVHETFRELGVDAIVTSVSDGRHSSTSLHYSGFAIDWRTRDLPDDLARTLLRDRIVSRLGVDYEIILESHHLHCAWEPRGQVS